jgi:hypothetical protein
VLADQSLNFFAFLAAFSAAGSPLANFSAPTFLPFVGHPYFGLKRLHDVSAKKLFLL